MKLSLCAVVVVLLAVFADSSPTGDVGQAMHFCGRTLLEAYATLCYEPDSSIIRTHSRPPGPPGPPGAS